MRISSYLLLLPLSFTLGCPGEVDKSTDSADSGDSGDSADTEDSGDTEDSTDDGVHTPGTITGHISFDLYTTDESGETVSVDWADYYGEEFPFGSVFVSGLSVNDESVATYWATDVVVSPSPEGDDYELEFGFDEDTDVYVYAALDYWSDGLIAPADPSALYIDAVTVQPDTEVGDIDITISVVYYDFSGGGGSWDPDAWVLLTGDANITETYAEGAGMVLVYDSTGYGPYGAAYFTPTATDDGATATYSVYAPKSMGTAELLGAWDSNLNDLIDPADKWGGYSTDGDAIELVTIGTENLDGYDLTIPLGTPPVSIVPFVILGGDVSIDATMLSEMTSTSSLIVTAQKYRPSGSFEGMSEAKTYDYAKVDYADVAATNTYSLLLPANTVTYIWACIDKDGDGTVNEEGEPCGQPVSAGRVATGTTSNFSLDITIAPPD